jgi:hypothetical protein
MVAASDTLSIFLREMRAGYPELSAVHGADQMAPGKGAPLRAAMTTAADPIVTGSILPDRRKLKR